LFLEMRSPVGGKLDPLPAAMLRLEEWALN
jgi:hypothetical protein